MKYTTTGTRLNHKIFIRTRQTNFDVKKHFGHTTIKNFVDHTKMKGHEFAAFQKRMFLRMKKEKKRRRILFTLTILITILIIIGFLVFWNTYDFSLLKSSEF
jgi:hypothetical protein